MTTLMSFKAKSGVTFLVRVIQKGERYGRGNCLVHDQNPPMVEFFDGRYVTKYDPLGQFVSRYFIETIRDCEGGVVLDTGAEAWQITDSERRCVVIWADGVVAGTNFGRN